MADNQSLAEKNPVTEVQKRYTQRYKSDGESQTHKIVSVEEASALVDPLVDVRDKAILLFLFKTGIRKGELISLNVDSVNLKLKGQSLILQSTKKRTNRTVFFDDEAAYYLRRWLAIRERRAGSNCEALFLSTRGERLDRRGVDYMIRKAALRVGLHDANSDRMEDHFSAHCCRHWFTTHLLRAGMRREYVQWLRGGTPSEKLLISIFMQIRRTFKSSTWRMCRSWGYDPQRKSNRRGEQVSKILDWLGKVALGL